MTAEEKHDQPMDDELAAYEKMRQGISKAFSDLHDRLNVETINKAIERATSELKEAGTHSMEAISNASEALKKDIISSTNNLKPKVNEVTEEARKQFNHWLDKGGALWHDISQEAERLHEFSRDKGGAFLVNVIRGLSEWGQEVSEKLDTSLNYKTGETSHGGEFVCTNCKNKIHLKQPGRIPPCPKCTKTDFRRA